MTDGRERLDEGMHLQQQLPEPAVDMDMSDTEIAGNIATTTAVDYTVSVLEPFCHCFICDQKFLEL